ncbi:MAG: hypothetical protein KGL64_00270 [Acidobacteriota bacterium]|nr:hypothetical protein [Acidobacteriota bacterium]
MSSCAWDGSGNMRWQRVLANGALAVGLLLRLLEHPAGQAARDGLDGVVGLLLGISIGANLMVVWKRRRCARQN